MAEKQLKKDMPGYEALRSKHSAFKSRGNLAPEFENFWGFYGWAMGQGWKPGAHICVRDWTKHIGPDNCYLRFLVDRTVNEPEQEKPTEIIRGGLANKPCNGCPNERQGGCVSYANCDKYREWIKKSWKQFNDYWKKYGDRKWLSPD